MIVKLREGVSDFAEDKDKAAEIRELQIRPALRRGERVVLDFSGVSLTTQSFIHALISGVLRSDGEKVLKRIEFKGCAPGVRGIVETVVQYSLETLEEPGDGEVGA